MKNFYRVFGLVTLGSSLAFAQGNQPNYSDQPQTGTTDRNGNPQYKSGTITDSAGNTANAPMPAGSDPTAGPANRNPYNDRNYRPGAPGTSASGTSPNATDPRLSGNPNTLGTAAPAEINRPTPGLTVPNGQTDSTRNGTQGSPSGNPGPIGNGQAPVAAPTSGGVGAGGSGTSGTPGSISNSGTHGINGSGH